MDTETWKIVVEGAKLQNYLIFCAGSPEKPYGFAIFAKKTDPGISMHLQPCLNTVCFRCKNIVSSVYYLWIFREEMKSGNPASIGEYKPVCPVCLFK